MALSIKTKPQKQRHSYNIKAAWLHFKKMRRDVRRPLSVEKKKEICPDIISYKDYKDIIEQLWVNIEHDLYIKKKSVKLPLMGTLYLLRRKVADNILKIENGFFKSKKGILLKGAEKMFSYTLCWDKKEAPDNGRFYRVKLMNKSSKREVENLNYE